MSQQNDIRCYTAVLYNTLMNCFLKLSSLNIKLLNPNSYLCLEPWHKVILPQVFLMVCTSIQTINLTVDQKTILPGYFRSFCPRNAFKRHVWGKRPTIHPWIKPHSSTTLASFPEARCVQGSWIVSFDKINSFLSFFISKFCSNAFHLGFHALCTVTDNCHSRT